MNFVTDLRYAARSLSRVKGLAVTVILTLALGIGANAAIFSVVRGVLLRPLANRDEDRLIYIRQTAGGIGAENANFSVPEIRDFQSRSTTHLGVRRFLGDRVHADRPGRAARRARRRRRRLVLHVMGLRPVAGRLLDATDDGPKAAGAAVLTHRFWTTTLGSDPGVIGKTVRLGDRPATIVGVLEPSVPYPSETEIIANVVTSPHHLSATMVDGRVHRMTELFGRLAPNADLEAARAELRTIHAAMLKDHPESYPKSGGLPDRGGRPARSDHVVGADRAAGAAGGVGAGVRDRVLERGEPDPRALRAAPGGAGDPRGARRERLGAAAHAAGREPAAVRRRRAARGRCWRGRWWRSSRATRRASRCARWT